MITKFEEARAISARALQISMGAPVLLNETEGLTRPEEIAEKELKKGKLPISIVREYPNGDEEIVNLQGEEIG